MLRLHAHSHQNAASADSPREPRTLFGAIDPKPSNVWARARIRPAPRGRGVPAGVVRPASALGGPALARAWPRGAPARLVAAPAQRWSRPALAPARGMVVSRGCRCCPRSSHRAAARLHQRRSCRRPAAAILGLDASLCCRRSWSHAKAGSHRERWRHRDPRSRDPAQDRRPGGAEAAPGRREDGAGERGRRGRRRARRRSGRRSPI